MRGGLRSTLALLIVVATLTTAFHVPTPRVPLQTLCGRHSVARCARHNVARCAQNAACHHALMMTPRPARRAEMRAGQQAQQGPTAVYALILLNILIFLGDKIFRIKALQALFLYHSQWAWWQLLTACFCHASRSHLSGNLFLLLLFGRSVEDDLGWGGLAFCYAFCGVAANLVSLIMLPSNTVSLGASGAVFGLFAVSTLVKLSWRELDWRKLVEGCVLGEFVFGRVMEEVRTAAVGGIQGINHVAHISGAGAGVILVILLRYSLRVMGAAEGRNVQPS